VREGSSLRLNHSENAVDKPSVSVLLERGTPSIFVDIEGTSLRLILDTGFSDSILRPGMSRRDVKVTGIKPYGVTGKVLDIKGRQSASFEINGRRFKHAFLVCSLPTEAAGLPGTDFMAKAAGVIDFECESMALIGIPNVSRCVMRHQQGTPHSPYSRKVKKDTAFDLPNRRGSAWTRSSLPAPATRRMLSRMEYD